MTFLIKLLTLCLNGWLLTASDGGQKLEAPRLNLACKHYYHFFWGGGAAEYNHVLQRATVKIEKSEDTT